MKILFMGGHELGKITLEYLLKMGKDIAAVVITDTDNAWYKGVDTVALEYQLPLLKEKDINRPEFLERVKAIDPELIVVVNFDQILKEELIGIPIKGCINTHASLLPKYRGRAPLNWAILKGEKETGVTVHYINTGVDTGGIILQRVIPINDEDYVEDVLEKVMAMYPDIVNEAVDLIRAGKAVPRKQDISLGFYFGRRSAKDGQINWGQSANEIVNLIRAVSRPYPGAYTYYEDKKIIVWRAGLVKQRGDELDIRSGTVLEINDNGILIKGNGRNIIFADYEKEDNCDIIVGNMMIKKED